MPRRPGPLAIALLASALLGVAPAGVMAEDHQKTPDLETAFPPSARPGPVEEPGVVEPTDATMDLPEAIMRGLGAYSEPTPEERAAEAAKKFHWNAVPFILTNPLVGFGFGVAGAGIVRFEDDVAKLTKFATNILYTVKNQLSIPLRTSLFFGKGNWSLVGYANWRYSPLRPGGWAETRRTPPRSSSTRACCGSGRPPSGGYSTTSTSGPDSTSTASTRSATGAPPRGS